MTNKTTIIFLLAVLFFLAAVLFSLRRTGDDFNLPTGGETKKETILVEKGSEFGEAVKAGESEKSEKEIMVTDGVKHSVPLGEINTLLARDSIPSLDSPKFESVQSAGTWLADSEPGIALSLDGVNRFYPYKVLTWHEIVNDIINGKRVLITYCPLCLTGYALDPLVKGERVEFGTSGKLWKSNLVMYDRKTESLWSQVLREAIVGEMTGNKLALIPTDQVRYGEWKKVNPDGMILSRNTGFTRNYDYYPYAGGNYFEVDSLSLGLVGSVDNRLPANAFVFGVVINGRAKAYYIEAVKERGVLEDSFEGVDIVMRHDKKLDAVRMFEKLSDSTEKRLNPVSGFWFSWAASYPGTELLK